MNIRVQCPDGTVDLCEAAINYSKMIDNWHKDTETDDSTNLTIECNFPYDHVKLYNEYCRELFNAEDFRHSIENHIKLDQQVDTLNKNLVGAMKEFQFMIENRELPEICNWLSNYECGFEPDQDKKVEIIQRYKDIDGVYDALCAYEVSLVKDPAEKERIAAANAVKSPNGIKLKLSEMIPIKYKNKIAETYTNLDNNESEARKLELADRDMIFRDRMAQGQLSEIIAFDRVQLALFERLIAFMDNDILKVLIANTLFYHLTKTHGEFGIINTYETWLHYIARDWFNMMPAIVREFRRHKDWMNARMPNVCTVDIPDGFGPGEAETIYAALTLSNRILQAATKTAKHLNSAEEYHFRRGRKTVQEIMDTHKDDKFETVDMTKIDVNFEHFLTEDQYRKEAEEEAEKARLEAEQEAEDDESDDDDDNDINNNNNG